MSHVVRHCTIKQNPWKIFGVSPSGLRVLQSSVQRNAGNPEVGNTLPALAPLKGALTVVPCSEPTQILHHRRWNNEQLLDALVETHTPERTQAIIKSDVELLVEEFTRRAESFDIKDFGRLFRCFGENPKKLLPKQLLKVCLQVLCERQGTQEYGRAMTAAAVAEFFYVRQESIQKLAALADLSCEFLQVAVKWLTGDGTDRPSLDNIAVSDMGAPLDDFAQRLLAMLAGGRDWEMEAIGRWVVLACMRLYDAERSSYLKDFASALPNRIPLEANETTLARLAYAYSGEGVGEIYRNVFGAILCRCDTLRRLSGSTVACLIRSLHHVGLPVSPLIPYCQHIAFEEPWHIAAVAVLLADAINEEGRQRLPLLLQQGIQQVRKFTNKDFTGFLYAATRRPEAVQTAIVETLADEFLYRITMGERKGNKGRGPESMEIESIVSALQSFFTAGLHDVRIVLVAFDNITMKLKQLLKVSKGNPENFVKTLSLPSLVDLARCIAATKLETPRLYPPFIDAIRLNGATFSPPHLQSLLQETLEFPANLRAMMPFEIIARQCVAKVHSFTAMGKAGINEDSHDWSIVELTSALLSFAQMDYCCRRLLNVAIKQISLHLATVPTVEPVAMLLQALSSFRVRNEMLLVRLEPLLLKFLNADEVPPPLVAKLFYYVSSLRPSNNNGSLKKMQQLLLLQQNDLTLSDALYGMEGVLNLSGTVSAGGGSEPFGRGWSKLCISSLLDSLIKNHQTMVSSTQKDDAESVTAIQVRCKRLFHMILLAADLIQYSLRADQSSYLRMNLKDAIIAQGAWENITLSPIARQIAVFLRKFQYDLRGPIRMGPFLIPFAISIPNEKCILLDILEEKDFFRDSSLRTPQSLLRAKTLQYYVEKEQKSSTLQLVDYRTWDTCTKEQRQMYLLGLLHNTGSDPAGQERCEKTEVVCSGNTDSKPVQTKIIS